MPRPNCLKAFVDAENGQMVDKELTNAFIAIRPLSGPEASVTKMYKCSEECAFACGVVTVGGVFNVPSASGECAAEIPAVAADEQVTQA
jgi:hypothetical protein